MNLTLIVAFLVIVAGPVYAQLQQPGVDKLKADAKQVVKIISGDKLKTETYCEIAKLSDQGVEVRDTTKAQALSAKINELEDKLGPEYIALKGGLMDVDPESQDGQEISSILDTLDTLCED
jgi:hypothetical protein